MRSTEEPHMFCNSADIRGFIQVVVAVDDLEALSAGVRPFAS